MIPLVKSSEVQKYARIAGWLILISILAGGFGELFVLSSLMVDGDASATANNIISGNFIFRLGFAAYLVEAICDVTLILIFYLLLRPVNKNLALLTVLFGLVSTCTFAFAELFYAAVPLILDAGYLKSFSKDQIDSLAMLSLKLYGYGGEVFMVFYGLNTLMKGYLVFHSGYLPKFLGILMIVAGSCFCIRNFLLVLSPLNASMLFLLPMGISFLLLSLRLLIKGVDLEKWNEKTALRQTEKTRE